MRITMSKTASLCGLKPEILAVRPMVINAAERLGAEHLVIHCIRDGQHSVGSKHYAGYAEDYDVPGWDADQMGKWAADVREGVSAEFDVIAEPTHLHVEYDPKKNTRV